MCKAIQDFSLIDAKGRDRKVNHPSNQACRSDRPDKAHPLIKLDIHGSGGKLPPEDACGKAYQGGLHEYNK
jgi:hypothetical protein